MTLSDYLIKDYDSWLVLMYVIGCDHVSQLPAPASSLRKRGSVEAWTKTHCTQSAHSLLYNPTQETNLALRIEKDK